MGFYIIFVTNSLFYFRFCVSLSLILKKFSSGKNLATTQSTGSTLQAVFVEFVRVHVGKTTNKCKTQWQRRSKKPATGECNGRVYRVVEPGREWGWNGDSCFLFTLRRLSIRNGSTPVGSSLRVLRLRHPRVTGKRSRPLVGGDSLHFFNPGIVFMCVQWHFPVPLLLHRPAPHCPAVRPSVRSLRKETPVILLEIFGAHCSGIHASHNEIKGFYR